jgi:ribonuclease P protein component
LRGSAAFARLFRSGRRLEAERVQLLALPAAEAPGRIGYVIGSRHLPRAVDRNRLRRMLREIFRARRGAAGRFDIVLRLRGACSAAELASVAAEAASLLDVLAGSQAR